MDKATWLGLIIGFGAILIGNLVEGGHIDSLLQFTAFIIVLGGTLGAVMVSNTMESLKMGIDLLKSAFHEESIDDLKKSMNSVVELSRIAKKENLIILESHLSRVPDSFTRNVIKSIIDGVHLEQIREIFDAEIDAFEEKLLNGAKVWTDAGGFSPTIGIIGAVLGLIHVMGNLSDTSKLGAGIAVAFVATVYGVSFANLLFLPLGNKLKKRAQNKVRQKRILLDGALLIGTETSPQIIEQKLFASINDFYAFDLAKKKN